MDNSGKSFTVLGFTDDYEAEPILHPVL